MARNLWIAIPPPRRIFTGGCSPRACCAVSGKVREIRLTKSGRFRSLATRTIPALRDLHGLAKALGPSVQLNPLVSVTCPWAEIERLARGVGRGAYRFELKMIWFEMK